MRRPNAEKLTPRARSMRKAPSDAAKKLWQSLRNNQLDGLKFRRELPIDHYVADFACISLRLVVEVDGDQHADAVEYDAQRTAILNELGWRVIRFTSSEVVRDLDAVLATILVHARPSP